METVRSADGTPIAYEQTGNGRPVILVRGAFNLRKTVAGLAAALAASGRNSRRQGSESSLCGRLPRGPPPVAHRLRRD